MNLRVSGRRAGSRVDVVTAKVAAPFQCVLDGQIRKILTAEGNNLALRDVPGQLVLTGRG